MFKHLFIDIETIPGQRADLRDLIASTVTHPGNISKAETIAKWNEEQRPAAVEEAISRTSLDGAFGQVCVISAAIDDAEPVILMESFWDDPAAEKLLLESLRDWMDGAIEPNEVMGISVVGHNVSAFDLRFLIQRSIINGVRPHPVLARAAQAKPWETEKVFDTMVQWAGVGNRISMDKLCMVLGIPGKGEITGADVWPLVKAGRIAEVATYCADDVRRTRAIFRRMAYSAHIEAVQAKAAA